MRHLLHLGNKLLLTALFLTAAASAPALAASGHSPAPAGVVPCRTGELHVIRQLGSADKGERSQGLAALRFCGTSILPGLERAMLSDDVRERRGSVIGLALFPVPGLAAEPLLAALRDQDAAVRSRAAYGLARIGTPVAGDTAKLLGSENERIRNSAAYALSLMGKKAVPALCSALKSTDPFLRSRAAMLLGRLGRDGLAAIPAMVNALDINDPRAMHVVAESIDLIGPSPRVLLYHYMLLGNPPDTLVGRLGGQAAPILTRLLTRPGTLTGQTAFRALAAMGVEARPALEAALRSGAPRQRLAAALLLIRLDPGIAPDLPEEIRSILVESSRLHGKIPGHE